MVLLKIAFTALLLLNWHCCCGTGTSSVCRGFCKTSRWPGYIL